MLQGYVFNSFLTVHLYTLKKKKTPQLLSPRVEIRYLIEWREWKSLTFRYGDYLKIFL